MARWLKQSTSVDVPIGPFLDSTDAVTAETALTITQPDIRLKKNGGAWAQKAAAQTLSHEENGWYEVTLDATDTNTLGLLQLAVHESGALPVWHEFLVVPANVWDSLFGADKLQVHADEITAGLITAAAIATGAIDADAVAADAVTEIQSGLSTLDAAGVRTAVGLASANLDTQLSGLDTKLDTIDNFLDTEVAAILADTNELQTDWADGGRLDLILDARASQASVNTVDDFLDTEVAAILAAVDTEIGTLTTNLATVDTVVDAIKAVTDLLPDAGALTSIATATNLATVDTVVDAIKAKTDSLTFTVAGQVDANMQSINDVTITGNGQVGTEFGV